MPRDTRTTEQISNAIAAEAKLARQIADDPMRIPEDVVLYDALHDQMNKDLTELERRS
ncbi:hypothetical protein ACIQVK_21515 [Streptomyces sp. NPDC090493]|uniref:hypothetical protein n=1 Tax=Streptomyces sp. NPDC090493 TaxID=3365964 RepID=UPI0037F363AD